MAVRLSNVGRTDGAIVVARDTDYGERRWNGEALFGFQRLGTSLGVAINWHGGAECGASQGTPLTCLLYALRSTHFVEHGYIFISITVAILRQPAIMSSNWLNVID
jgi:hypothetical protein